MHSRTWARPCPFPARYLSLSHTHLKPAKFLLLSLALSRSLPYLTHNSHPLPHSHAPSPTIVTLSTSTRLSYCAGPVLHSTSRSIHLALPAPASTKTKQPPAPDRTTFRARCAYQTQPLRNHNTQQHAAFPLHELRIARPAETPSISIDSAYSPIASSASRIFVPSVFVQRAKLVHTLQPPLPRPLSLPHTTAPATQSIISSFIITTAQALNHSIPSHQRQARQQQHEDFHHRYGPRPRWQCRRLLAHAMSLDHGYCPYRPSGCTQRCR